MKIKQEQYSMQPNFKQKFYSFCWGFKYRFIEYKWAVYNYFRSSQHWLIKQIPRSYQDKPELITLLLFAILVDYVEKEGGLDCMDYDWSEEVSIGHTSESYVKEIKMRERSLMDTYNYIKFHRPIMRKQLQKLLYSDKHIDQYFSHEKLCEEKDAEALQIIVKNAPFLWT